MDIYAWHDVNKDDFVSPFEHMTDSLKCTSQEESGAVAGMGSLVRFLAEPTFLEQVQSTDNIILDKSTALCFQTA